VVALDKQELPTHDPPTCDTVAPRGARDVQPVPVRCRSIQSRRLAWTCRAPSTLLTTATAPGCRRRFLIGRLYPPRISPVRGRLEAQW